MKYTALHTSTSKHEYYQSSRNRQDTVKENTSRSLVAYYISYVHAMS